MQPAVLFRHVVLMALLFRFCEGTTNTDKQYGRWNKTAIYYYMDPAFTATEVSYILQAINRITTTLSPCLAFIPTSPTATVFKIKFTPLTGGTGSAPATFCYSYPGINLALQQTTLEQPVVLARGATGCLDTPCNIMRYIALVLGKRNEHQRGDRDSWIIVQPDSSLAVPGAYRKYASTEAYWSLFPYDYCSITHNIPTEYANAGVQAFTFPADKPPGFIPKLCQLSTTDCRLLSMMYQCNSALCATVDCAGQKAPPPAVTPPIPMFSAISTKAFTDIPCGLSSFAPIPGLNITFAGGVAPIVCNSKDGDPAQTLKALSAFFNDDATNPDNVVDQTSVQTLFSVSAVTGQVVPLMVQDPRVDPAIPTKVPSSAALSIQLGPDFNDDTWSFTLNHGGYCVDARGRKSNYFTYTTRVGRCPNL